MLTLREKQRMRLHKLISTEYLKYREKYDRISNTRICNILAERHRLSAGGVRKMLIETLGERYESYSIRRTHRNGEAQSDER